MSQPISVFAPTSPDGCLLHEPPAPLVTFLIPSYILVMYSRLVCWAVGTLSEP